MRGTITTAPPLDWKGNPVLRDKVICPRSHKELMQNQGQGPVFLPPRPELFPSQGKATPPIHTHESFSVKVGQFTQALNTKAHHTQPLALGDSPAPMLLLDHGQRTASTREEDSPGAEPNICADYVWAPEKKGGGRSWDEERVRYAFKKFSNSPSISRAQGHTGAGE